MPSVLKWPSCFLTAMRRFGELRDPPSPGALAGIGSPLVTSGVEGGDL